MSTCWMNVQVMSGREMSTDPEGRVVSSCVCIFSSWTNRHLFGCLFWDHLLVFSDIEKRTSSLVNKRVLMKGFHIVFLVMCCQINITWFWVCDRGQTMSQEPAELHCPKQFPDQTNTSQMTGDGSSSLMCPQIFLLDGSSAMVWWSSTHCSTAWKRGQSPNNLGMDKQLTSFQPACFLTEHCSLLLLCSAHSWWFSADISPKWPC